MRFDANYREDVTLAGGLRIRFRTVSPSDRQKLAEGFARLSAESRHRRFFSTKTALTDAELRFLTTPDGIDHVAIGTVEIDADGEEGDGVGIGHLVRVAERPEVAELALTVLDARQGMGIGRMLLERLIAAAAERGIQRIRCHLLADNVRMRRLIRHALGDAAFTREGETMTGEFPVPATTEPEQVSQDEAAAPLFGLLRLLAAGSVMSVNFTLAALRYGATSMAPYPRAPKSAAKDETGGES
ncbi:MAG: GNAT family N-acetyltransferase [Gammaproteobacteria bacterium]